MSGNAWPHWTISSSPRCFLSMVNISMQKTNDIDPLFPEILTIKNPATWLTKSILAYNLWNNFRKTENYKVFHFRLLPAKINDKNYMKTQEKFGPNLGPFYVFKGKQKFFGKSTSLYFLFHDFYHYVKFQKQFTCWFGKNWLQTYGRMERGNRVAF